MESILQLFVAGFPVVSGETNRVIGFEVEYMANFEYLAIENDDFGFRVKLGKCRKQLFGFHVRNYIP